MAFSVFSGFTWVGSSMGVDEVVDDVVDDVVDVNEVVDADVNEVLYFISKNQFFNPLYNHCLFADLIRDMTRWGFMDKYGSYGISTACSNSSAGISSALI